MSTTNCGCRRDCVVIALVASAIIGVLTAFLFMSGVIAVAPVFLWVALGVAVVYLAVLAGAAILSRRTEYRYCLCRALNTLLVAILGAALFAVVLLAVGITATSIVSAILVGLLLFFLALILTATACLVRCVASCGE